MAWPLANRKRLGKRKHVFIETGRRTKILEYSGLGGHIDNVRNESGVTKLSYCRAETARWTPANIGSVVLGFMLFWPVGLFVLFYVLSGGDMAQVFHRTKDWVSDKVGGMGATRDSSGNAAFDSYRDETLSRLEEEQRAFGDFMERLKRARDQEEFDRFMNERRGSST